MKDERVPLPALCQGEYVLTFSMTIDALKDGTAAIVKDNKGQSWLIIRDKGTIKLYIQK